MFDKLFEMQRMAQEAKDKLELINVEYKSADGRIGITLTAGKTIKDFNISADLMGEENKDELEDMLVIHLQKAFDLADQKAQEEMQKMAGGMMGGLGNLFGE